MTDETRKTDEELEAETAEDELTEEQLEATGGGAATPRGAAANTVTRGTEFNTATRGVDFNTADAGLGQDRILGNRTQK